MSHLCTPMARHDMFTPSESVCLLPHTFSFLSESLSDMRASIWSLVSSSLALPCLP